MLVHRRDLTCALLADGLPVPIDQHGQVIDVMLPTRRDVAANRFLVRALTVGASPVWGNDR